jgi:hypothetical protein
MRLAVLLLVLLLAGCGEAPRAWNPGRVPLVTVSSSVVACRDYHQRIGSPVPVAWVTAWCDKLAREIRLPDDVARPLLVALVLHEFGHEIEDEYPDVWRHLNAMSSPLFPCGEDGAVEDRQP